MENYCVGCTSKHQKLLNTWTDKGSLQPSNYNPFQISEGYCCGGKYDTASTTWTLGSNVTPDNSSIYQTGVLKFTPYHKESFTLDSHNTYARANQTWLRQPKYTSN